MRTAKTTTQFAMAALAASMLLSIGILPAGAADPGVCEVADGTDCNAPIPGEPISEASSQTVGFVGLRWDFGAEAPAITAGLRYTRTDIDDSVLGAKFDLSLDLEKDVTFTPTIRLLGVAGNRDIQGELGVGIRTFDWQGMMTAGVQLPYINAGANLTFDGTLAPFVEVNGLGRPAAPVLVNGEFTCPEGPSRLVPVVDGMIDPDNYDPLTVDDSDVVGGFTCFAVT